MYFTSSHPPEVKKKSFIEGEALILLRASSSKKIFREKSKAFGSRVIERGYPENTILTTLSEFEI